MKRQKKMHKGSFTIEASIYVPMVLFLVINTLNCGILFFQQAKNYKGNTEIESLDIIKEFYNYQILGEIQEEIEGD